MHRVLTIGTGIAGLTAAWELEKAGCEVVCVETKERVGGNIHTNQDGPYRTEAGPHSFLGTAESIFLLCRELGIEDRLCGANPEADKRFIYKAGNLHPLPSSALAFLRTPLLSLKAKLFFMGEPFRTRRHPPETSVDVWMRAHLGPEIADYFVQPFVSGIYAGDATRLSMAAAFPKFYGFEQATGSMIRGAIRFMRAQKKIRAADPEAHPRRKGTWSFDEGMGVLPAAFQKKLKAKIVADAELGAISPNGEGWSAQIDGAEERFDGVICATRSFEAAEIVRGFDAELAETLDSVVYAPVSVLHIAIDNANLSRPLDGFGFLVPPNQKRPILGAIWVSTIFEGRCPEGQSLMAIFMGGMTGPDTLALDDDALEKLALEELTRTCLKEPKSLWRRINRYPNAIPQYVPEHLKAKAALEASMERRPTLAFAGNYVGGISAADSAGWAKTAAAKLVEALK